MTADLIEPDPIGDLQAMGVDTTALADHPLHEHAILGLMREGRYGEAQTLAAPFVRLPRANINKPIPRKPARRKNDPPGPFCLISLFTWVPLAMVKLGARAIVRRWQR